MFGFKKKKADEIKKPIYDMKGQMIIIKCPYCNTTLREVYSMRVTSIKIDSCQYCNKSIKG